MSVLSKILKTYSAMNAKTINNITQQTHLISLTYRLQNRVKCVEPLWSEGRRPFTTNFAGGFATGACKRFACKKLSM